MSSSSGSGCRDICPSCLVCGGEASGFHYGVDSCEGCKGFFRRCITQGMTNRCANEEKCEITPFSRNSCQFCRLKKCFAVGMSREGSRLGRRPKNLKKCHAQEQKSYHRATGFRSSSTITSSTLDVNSPVVNRSLDSTALDKLRLSVSSDDKFSSSRSDGYPALSKDGFYHDTGVYDHKHLATDASSARSERIVALSTQKSTFHHHVTGLPSKTTLPRGYAELSTDCLRRPPAKVAAPYNADTIGQCRSRSASLGWSENHDYASEVRSASQSARSSSCSYRYDCEPPGPSSTFIKQENSDDCYDDAPVFDRRDFTMRSSDDFCDRRDLSLTRDFYAGVEARRVKDDPDNLLYHRNSKNGAWNGSTQIGSNAAAWGSDFPESSDPCFGSVVVTPTNCGETEEEEEEECGLVETPQELEVLISEATKLPDQVKLRLISHVITTVVDAHTNTCNYTLQKVAEGVQRYRDSVSSGQNSGARKDLNPSKIWNHFVENMAPVIKRVVRFSKKIPGFPELHQEDQIGLIKQGSFEVILTRYTQLFTPDGMFVPDMSALVSRDLIREMPMGKFFEEQYQFAEKFNRLGLDDAEIGLLSASMIVCPGRSGLLNPNAIHQLHILLLQSLYVYMKQSHPGNYDELFSETIHILPFIRRINASHAKQLNDIKMSTPQLFFPPLHDEVFDKTG